MGKNKSVQEKPGFRELIPTYSDNEIIMILKKRKDYQPEAAELAVKEAISRGIIFSEQDLFSSEYNEQTSGSSVFPVPENQFYRNKLVKSIVRMLFFIGILPFVKGLLIQNNGNWAEGSIVSLFGLIWILLVFFFNKKKDKRLLFAITGLAMVSISYFIYHFTSTTKVEAFDIFIISFVYLLLFYGILFLQKIIRKN